MPTPASASPLVTTPSGSTPAAEESLRVAVIGSGPHALSLLCRVVDDDADLLDEAERTRVAAKAGSRARSHAEVRKALQRRFVDAAAHLAGVAVFDSGGEWMGQWRRDFSALEIEHCRSHSDLHPCPHDFQSLRVWAEKHKRELEMWHMAYLDRGAARAAGFSGPYALPGTRLFLDFCASLVARVVCAMGPGPMFAGMRANLPWWQTAGHLCLVAVKNGATAVTLAARRPIVRKPFDVDLQARVVGDRRGEALSSFWAAPPCDRPRLIGRLRGGGSMAGEVEVESAAWRPAGGEGGGSFDVSFDDGSSERFDYVWLATGGEMDLSLVPLFAQLLAQVPIQTHGGLPALQQDLSWAAHCPLHLELGADALNLAGCRAGSVRIARLHKL
ncbi:hypothetical protein EMIHUDRAFT_213942 [Emiliania huxleyi CCMP1516]|uniref:FAD-dependent urate hydroxylase HpyO FAD/NAD(P)-binding domain-containing protein n=2 Tax=Emiliania huxleyi TaxID=2903 RepID=A0A0D3ILL3_EMIH1|nr:hypothetical protein EMIHUDRAFT_213942 [Emiliania huxleyi CCMP1516]EOD12148.1 hypothetical protein EMIHUDRAFT_213942 [Emiliania huxleyi CCMP1516]|eukprot:XP_005764577.1 hypothetical protein EMIHUDRAFT_213942 [Emiliania huxleyi CCMP1516]